MTPSLGQRWIWDGINDRSDSSQGARWPWDPGSTMTSWLRKRPSMCDSYPLSLSSQLFPILSRERSRVLLYKHQLRTIPRRGQRWFCAKGNDDSAIEDQGRADTPPECLCLEIRLHLSPVKMKKLKTQNHGRLSYLHSKKFRRWQVSLKSNWVFEWR